MELTQNELKQLDLIVDVELKSMRVENESMIDSISFGYDLPWM